MVIVTAADDKFALPLGVTLYSAVANLAGVEAVSIYVIDGGISEENKRKIIEMLSAKRLEVSIRWVTPDLASLGDIKPTEWYSKAVYYIRLLIPELLPAEFDRALYLDSDMVVEKDLRLLWQQTVSDDTAFAVQDYYFPYVSSGEEAHRIVGLPPDTPTCNTGLLVMNLKRWREDNIGLRALEYIRRFEVPRSDQEALNAILAGKWGFLNPKWNVMMSDPSGRPLTGQAASETSKQVITRYGQTATQAQMLRPDENLFQEPFILHFVGFPKPWHFIYRGPARERWFDYLMDSGWFSSGENINEVKAHVWKIYNEYEPWLKPLYSVSRELTGLIPAGNSFILVDESNFEPELVEGRHSIPFLEKDGQYCGSPPDDATAIREFDRLRQSGASFIVFGWPAFWWLDHYRDFNRYLRSEYSCVLQNERVVVFDLRPNES